MDVRVFNSTLSILLPIAEWNHTIQLVVGGLSLLICLLLAYIVETKTPEEFSGKKVMLLSQLAGCFINALLYCLLQPFTLYPHKVFMFTGPFRTFGSETAAVIFVAWCAALSSLSCAAITTSFNHYIETMEQFKQKNILFEFFRNLSVLKRFIIYMIFDGVVVAIATASLFLSIDPEKDPSLVGNIYDYLTDNYAMINFKSKYGTLEILGGTMLIFIIFYIAMVFFLKRNVWTELEELRPSLSPRTFQILEQLSRLLIMIDLTPLLFFFLPTVIFIIIPFLLPSLVSTNGLLIFFTLLTMILYSLYPFVYYFLLLIGFKYYRRAFISILLRPISICRPSIAITDVNSTKNSS